MDGAETIDKQPDSLHSGLVTASMLDADPPGLRVLWIRWYSSFRGTGLRVGDRIVAVNGTALTRPADLAELQRMLPGMVGQINEAATWTAQGLAEEAPLTLRVRRHADSAGWQELAFTGVLRLACTYRNAQGRQLIGPGGPDTMANDGLGDAWSSWLEKWERWAESLLDDDWGRPSWLTDAARAELDTHTTRLAALAQKYPGPFADAVAKDAANIRALVDGRPYELSPDELAYRRLDDERADAVAAAGKPAHAEFLARIAAEQLTELPPPESLTDNHAALVGKVLVLPTIRPSEWISEATHNWLATRLGATWCFVDTEGEAAQRMQVAGRRYERRITPYLAGDYAIIGRIKPDPRMVIAQNAAVTGVEVEPLAAMIGDRVFVDLTAQQDGVSLFAGEVEAARPAVPPPGPDAQPAAVLGALFAALKAGDQDTWLALFADWRALPGERPLFYPYAPRVSASIWEDARRRILDEVVDVRVTWSDDPYVVINGDEYPGLSKVEEVALEVEHVRAVGAGFRGFRGRGLTRVWRVQRVHRADGPGPWRISTESGL